MYCLFQYTVKQIILLTLDSRINVGATFIHLKKHKKIEKKMTAMP